MSADGREHAPAGPSDAEPQRAQSRHRVWGALAVAGFVAFAAYLVTSARDAAVPVGAQGPMAGMSMPQGGGGAVAFRTRDIDGRALRLPGGRPGALVFVQPSNCEACVAATRTVSAAVRRSGSRAAMNVVVLDSAVSRQEMRSFARAAGNPRMRIIVDDRNGSLQMMLGRPTLGSVAIYDASGRIVGRPRPGSPALERALRRGGA